MKSQLRLKPHSVLEDANIIEVWFDGRLIATVTGADGPGVRIITKYDVDIRTNSGSNRTTFGRAVDDLGDLGKLLVQVIEAKIRL